MEPRTLSASAIKAFMDCPAHFKAQYLDRIRITSPGGGAGDFGSALHAVLEWWVVIGRHVSGSNSKDLGDKFKEIAPNYGIDEKTQKIGIKILFAWYDRWMEQQPIDVISAEVKSSFPLKIKDAAGEIHEIGVTYIWDRCDRKSDGSIVVTDYKSWMTALTPDDIYVHPQVRLYALAAAIQFKEDKPPFIWVALDQLRYGTPTAVCFSRDDIRNIFAWLKGIYAEILADDGSREKVGDACRWCVRSPECKSFTDAVAAGTVMTYTSPADAARKVAEINAVMGALIDTKGLLLTYLENYLQDEGILEEKFHIEGLDQPVLVKIAPSNKRTPNIQGIAEVIGAELYAEIGKMNLGDIDELLAGDRLDDEQKAAVQRHIKQTITTSINAKFVKS